MSGATLSTAQRNITEDLQPPSILINKIKSALRLTQLYVYFIISLLLAASFVLKRPSYLYITWTILKLLIILDFKVVNQ